MGTIVQTIEKYGKDKARLMDILMDIQEENGFISEEAVKTTADTLKISKADVIQTMSFYHFFNDKPAGKYKVYINDSAVANMKGKKEIEKAFEAAAGCKVGEVTADGQIGLFDTADMGMNDQEPAVLINNVPFTCVTPEKVNKLVEAMKAGKCVKEMVTEFGDGNNAHELVKVEVKNNIQKEGAVIFNEYTSGTAVKKAIEVSPETVIEEVKTSYLRGRGGAGFPTGMKWDFTRKAQGDVKYIICNADEGEPGTFKDRVLLTEKADMLFEGMAVAGYAIGAEHGVLYLRQEYKYLQAFLEKVLEDLRTNNVLGKNIAGKDGFNFDIRIQFGMGAYVCGEETALIESVEGKRGEPRNKPPFPAQKGYLDKPTSVNNVETFCSVSRIMEKGGAWYNELGTKESAGTKVLSISGDVEKPGIYEIEWGMSVQEMLDMVGAKDTQAVQVAGPSGICVPAKDFGRKIAIEDLPTGGSMIVINNQRDVVKDLALNFMKFFEDESCGSCSPCRALNVLITQKLEKLVSGKGIKTDIEDLEKWGTIMESVTRCGLGQTAGNPVLTTIQNFRDKYEAMVKDVEYESEFNMEESVKASCKYVDRTPKIHH